jgi:predicted RNA binding protein YcfA (HicA-like mRNA interferase family)
MKGRELRQRFKAKGWKKLRQDGSHERWGKGTKRETISTAHGDEVPKGLLHKLLKTLDES